MTRGILRLIAVLLTATASLLGGSKVSDASATPQLGHDKAELQQRLKALRGESNPDATQGKDRRQAQWYNWNNWQNWDNWSNWGNW